MAIKDYRITSLLNRAEQIADEMGSRICGPAHFILATLELPNAIVLKKFLNREKYLKALQTAQPEHFPSFPVPKKFKVQRMKRVFRITANSQLEAAAKVEKAFDEFCKKMNEENR